MPELPEVETIAHYLRDGKAGEPGIIGQVAAQPHLLWEGCLHTPSPAELLVRLPGQSVEQVSRRGKFLIIHLAVDQLIVHLRMSGDLRLEPSTDPIQPHDRFLLDFKDGIRLAFNDPRKFGRIWLVADPQEVVSSLGPEPLDPAFTPPDLYQRLHARHRLLKPLLLDQSFLAGLGNIYTDEALHLARLHPNLTSDRVTQEQAATLFMAIRKILQDGIAHNGASIDWVYRGGDFQNHFRAYQRTGLPCPVCGTPISRILVGQRGTHFCPTCQILEI